MVATAPHGHGRAMPLLHSSRHLPPDRHVFSLRGAAVVLDVVPNGLSSIVNLLVRKGGHDSERCLTAGTLSGPPLPYNRSQQRK